MIHHFLSAARSATEHLEQIAENTAFTWLPAKATFTISILAFIAGVISTIYTICTFISQKKTERNTGLLNMSEQRRLLIEMIRHLYRNMVVSYSIAVKMKAKNFMVYPSEEHLKKMSVELGDIHLNLFYRSDKEHQEINKFYMEVRNYNMELDVICDHFRNPDIDTETKERDLRTLCFKCDYLTMRIITILNLVVWDENQATQNCFQEARDIIEKEIKEKNSMPGIAYTENFKPYDNQNSFYAKELFANDTENFLNGFNENVNHECGTNSEGAEKIHMITLRQR